MPNDLPIYEKIGLTNEDVFRIQHELFPAINNKSSIADMLQFISQNYPCNSIHFMYAVYLLGYHMGSARIKEAFGLSHILNPDEL